jgi:hypothetical protein
MSPWSQDEINRTLSEVKQRSFSDPAFRALSLKDPHAAIGKVNPRPLPEKVSVTFVEHGEDSYQKSPAGTLIVIALPPPLPNPAGLTDAELEDAAGGYEVNLKLTFES